MKKIFFSIVLMVCAVGLQAAEQITISEFLSKADTETTYRLRGMVTSIKSTYYGNFTLQDHTGSIFIYGLLDLNGQPKNFGSLNIEENDSVTLEGKYLWYEKGGYAEISNAQYISHTKSTWEPYLISIKEFINKADGNTYLVKGVVGDIYNTTYGNFYLKDATDSIYIFGLSDADGNTKRFASMNIYKGDTLTVKGKYTLYTNKETQETKHEIIDALYVSHVVVIPTDGLYFPSSFRNGWDELVGKSYEYKHPLYVAGFTSNLDSILVTAKRLYQPEEVSTNLWLGDSTNFYLAEDYNKQRTFALYRGFRSDTLHCGARLVHPRVVVDSAYHLRLVSHLEVEDNTPPTTPPDMNNASLVVCGTNIENYFYNWSGSNGAKSEEQFARQTMKLVNALTHINADIFAVCEIESGVMAGNYLVSRMNEFVGSDRYAYLDNGLIEEQNLSVGYIYRKDKVVPTDINPYFPYYSEGIYHKRMIIREFEEISSGERFAVSINHFKSKAGNYDSEQTRRYNAQNLVTALNNVIANSYFSTDRILILGDFNNYTCEWANHYVAESYKDVLPHESVYTDYSYVYKGQVGYLDRAFATSSMEEKITNVQPYHLNADYSYRRGYAYEDTSIYRYADHDPILVGLRFVEGGMTTDIDKAQSDNGSCTKFIRNGQLLIEYNGHSYNTQGIRVQ